MRSLPESPGICSDHSVRLDGGTGSRRRGQAPLLVGHVFEETLMHFGTLTSVRLQKAGCATSRGSGGPGM